MSKRAQMVRGRYACLWLCCPWFSMLCGAIGAAEDPPPHPAVVTQEFVFENPVFKSCHASTIVETPAGMVCAWFAGDREGRENVEIWLSRLTAAGWTPPVSVANGVQSLEKRFPCWNPVLVQVPEGPLVLYFKVGPNPDHWWGEVQRSTDHGVTWSRAERLPEGILGPVKNKPLRLADGRLLCPSSDELHGWVVRMETLSADGREWKTTGPLKGGPFGAIQPTILQHGKGRLQILCRTQQRVIAESWSEDYGATWSPLSATWLPNPNSGIDGLTLQDGRHLLVYNPTRLDRYPIVVALSKDGIDWKDVTLLDRQPGEYSYPAVIQTRDGRVHITYTWKRVNIRHVVLAADRL